MWTNRAVGFDELQDELNKPDVHDYFATIGVDVDQALFLFKALDVNGSGSIDLIEFLTGCHRLQGAAKTLDVMLIMRDTREILEASKEALHATNVLQQQMQQICDCCDARPSRRCGSAVL